MPTFAAVDIGSNSVRLKIAKLVHGRLQTVLEDREVTRLGEGVFRGGLLEPKSIADTVKVLRRFHRSATSIGVDKVRVVATSALRDARNSASFLEWVRSVTGWKVEIISGIEEGRLIHLGIQANTRLPRGPMLLMDLGGGSCELTISEGGQIVSMVSLPLGAVRLTEEFIQDDPPKKKDLERMRQFIAEEAGRLEPRVKRRGVSLALATSGTAETLAALAANLNHSGSRKNYVSRGALNSVVQQLSKKTLAERRLMPGLGPRRAEIIIAGATVYSELINGLELRGFTYSPLGLRDGMLAQMAAEYDRHTVMGKRIETERQTGLMQAAQHYAVDLTFAEHVKELTLQFFRQLKSIHQLPADYEEWLTGAAMLHEVGSFINRAGRHRHAYYLIANSEIYGFSAEQRRIMASISRYMGKSRPSPQDRAMRLLTPLDRQLVPRAVLLLRLARALNQGRKGAVMSVRAQVRESAVTLRLETKRGGAELEIWSVQKEAAYFKELFGRELLVAAS